MTIVRIEHSSDYTYISNQAIRDKRLSCKARGLHHLLLSYPNNWAVNIDHLAAESDTDGRAAIASDILSVTASSHDAMYKRNRRQLKEEPKRT